MEKEFVNAGLKLTIHKNHFESTYPLHWHEFYEISFVIAGNGIHFLNGEAYPLSRGSMFMLGPTDFHELIPIGSLDFYNVMFSREWVSEEFHKVLFNNGDANLALFEEDQCVEIERELKMMWEEYNSKESYYRQFIQGSLEKILVWLTRSHGVEFRLEVLDRDDSKVLPGCIYEALRYIQSNFCSPIALADIAARVHLSPNYFSELFHKHTGQSYQSYLLNLRLEYARCRLILTDGSISRISCESGFGTVSHFNREFKRKYGEKPSAYRNKGVTDWGQRKEPIKSERA